jgi:GT2 family glycosyltransferase
MRIGLMDPIVVLYYNKARLTRRCLDAILEAGYPAEIIYCFDNGSQKEVFGELSAEYPGLHHQRCRENGGFSKGFNLSLRWVFEMGFESALFLTNDTVITSGAVEALMKTGADTRAGMVAPRIAFLSDPEKIDSIGGYFDDEVFNLGHHIETGLQAMLDPARDYIPGTAVWVRRDCLEALDGTDESFHMFWEDVDLCFRAHRQEIPLARCYEARILHGAGQTTRKKPLYTTYYFHRNRIRFCARYLSGDKLEKALVHIEEELRRQEHVRRQQGDTTRLNYFDQLFSELHSARKASMADQVPRSR